ncbi:MAG: hypothetical protein Q4F72_12425, partial [Desulfovibrionaceae bacterium]|nr:hypothetical protein [Desulfovibrionaceae bacterium]
MASLLDTMKQIFADLQSPGRPEEQAGAADASSAIPPGFELNTDPMPDNLWDGGLDPQAIAADPLEVRTAELVAGDSHFRADPARMAGLDNLQREGSILAAWFLGLELMHEDNPAPDYPRARDLLARAAEAGHGPAFWMLHFLLMDRWDCGRDGGTPDGILDEALSWLDRGLAAGSPNCALGCLELHADHHLFPMTAEEEDGLFDLLAPYARAGSWPCLEGALKLIEVRHFRPDDARTAEMLTLLGHCAGELGFAPAQRLAGRLYRTGAIMCDQNFETARAWLEPAWEQGDVEAGCELAELRIESELPPLLATDADMAAAEECRRLLEACRAAGSARATALAGRLRTCNAWDCSTMLDEAEQLLKEAVDAGCPNPAADTAWSMMLGSRDSGTLDTLLRQAADEGRLPRALAARLDAMQNAGEDDWRRTGLRVLEHAAGQGCPRAWLHLARLRLNGLDGKPSVAAEGLAMLARLAESGCPDALGELAGIRLLGLYGTDPDPDEAASLAVRGWGFRSARCFGILVHLGMTGAADPNGDSALGTAVREAREKAGCIDDLFFHALQTGSMPLLAGEDFAALRPAEQRRAAREAGALLAGCWQKALITLDAAAMRM